MGVGTECFSQLTRDLSSVSPGRVSLEEKRVAYSSRGQGPFRANSSISQMEKQRQHSVSRHWGQIAAVTESLRADLKFSPACLSGLAGTEGQSGLYKSERFQD